MRLVFVSSVPYNEQKIIDLGIKKLSKYFDIDLISFEKFMNPNYPKFDCIPYKKMDNLNEFESIISCLEDEFFVVLTNNQLYRSIINESNLDYPLIAISKTFLSRKILLSHKSNLFYGFIHGHFKNSVKYYIKHRLLPRIMMISKIKHKRINYVIAPFNPNKLIYKKLIKVHHPKYDQLLEMKKNIINNFNSKYVVFVDQNIPFHPDYENILNIDSVDSNDYFEDLNNFFSYIENIYGFEIFIALDPKSNYKNNPFKGRKMFRGKTTELIYFSEFVLAHSSTSIFSAVALNKGIVLLTSKEISKYLSFISDYIAALSKQLNLQVLRIDSLKHSINIFDFSKYSKFIDKYLINKQYQNVSNSEIIYYNLGKMGEK